MTFIGGGLSFKQFLAVMAIGIAFIVFDGWMRERGKDPECVYMVLFIVAITYFFGRKKNSSPPPPDDQ